MENGFDLWYHDYIERKTLLTIALQKYNNGRMKRFLCELFMKEELIVLREIMEKAKELTGMQKEVSLGFKRIVEDVTKLT